MKISGIFFGIVIVAFLLPFMVVTCNGQKVASASGLQIVFGAKQNSAANKIENTMQEGLGKLGDVFGQEAQESAPETKSEKLPVNIPALIALLMAIVGLITAFVMKPDKFFVPLAAAVVGIIGLVLVTSSAKSGIGGLGGSAEYAAYLSVKPQFGYYLAFLGFILAGVFAFLGSKKKAAYTMPAAGFDQQARPNVIPPVAEADNEQSFFERAKDFVEDKIEDAGELVEKVKDKVDLDEVKDKIADNVNFDKVEAGLGKVIGKETAETVVDKVEDFVKPDEETKG